MVVYNPSLAIASPDVLALDEDDKQQSVKNDDSGKNDDSRKDEKDAASKDESTQTEQSTSDLLMPPALQSGAATGSQQSVDYFVQIALGNHPKIQAARQ